MTETIQRMRYCVRTTGNDVTKLVKSRIKDLDPESFLDLESNPVTFWIATFLTTDEISAVSGVLDVVVSDDQSNIVKPGEFDPYRFVVGASFRPMTEIIEKRWGQFSDRNGFHNLRFTNRGLCRMGQVFGWITALGLIDEMHHRFARRAAREFCERLDHLASYAASVELSAPIDADAKIPRYIIELDDAGEFNSFNILAFIPFHPSVQHEIDPRSFKYMVEDYRKPTLTDPGTTMYRYAFKRPGAWNGGLNYHGPGQGQTFTVTLDRHALWSVNT